MLFPSLLPPASPDRAAVCCHPAGCPARNKVAFCSPARCYSCPCSGQAAPHPARGAGTARQGHSPGRAGSALLCSILAVPGGDSGHLQSKQPQVNKRAKNSPREGKRERALSPEEAPTRFGAHSMAAEGSGRCPAVWPLPASRAAKKGKPQPLAVPAGGVSGPQGAREPGSRQGRGPAWSGTRPPVAAPGAGSAGGGDCGQWRVPRG